jgi:hypothetical protein
MGSTIEVPLEKRIVLLTNYPLLAGCDVNGVLASFITLSLDDFCETTEKGPVERKYIATESMQYFSEVQKNEGVKADDVLFGYACLPQFAYADLRLLNAPIHYTGRSENVDCAERAILDATYDFMSLHAETNKKSHHFLYVDKEYDTGKYLFDSANTDAEATDFADNCPWESSPLSRKPLDPKTLDAISFAIYLKNTFAAPAQRAHRTGDFHRAKAHVSDMRNECPPSVQAYAEMLLPVLTAPLFSRYKTSRIVNTTANAIAAILREEYEQAIVYTDQLHRLLDGPPRALKRLNS